MATAKKLPSGSWRCQVYSHTEELPQPDGTIKKKRIYESFTCDDPSPKGKRKCEQMAAEWAVNKEKRQLTNYSMTFGEALNIYINERSSVLSPASIRKYRNMERNCLNPLCRFKLKDITQDIIQNEVNRASADLSPKSVRDMHGLFSAVMARFCPEMVFRTALPKKIRPDIYVPSDADIQRLVECVKETDMEIPVYLAAFGAMRRGEISALEISDISGNVIHIHRTMVMTNDKRWVTKAPKSYAGDRFVTMPGFVIDKLPKSGERITKLRPNMISQRFIRVLESAGLPHFRFHDLRHYNASILHALGVPDAYIMRSGGWGNDSVLKDVYRHTMKEFEAELNSIAINHFEDMMQHKIQHEQKKA
ncbi:MAG: site-specific integrase [Eubacteriales bacterium]|nr:site-specific integrase [Eubacteriales bacterium]